METIDLAYLGLVIGAFSLFAVVLAYTAAIAKDRTTEHRRRVGGAETAHTPDPFAAHPAD